MQTSTRQAPPNETLRNPVQKNHSILVGRSCGLLTQRRNWKYRLFSFRDRVSLILSLPLTSCIFLIARGCVLFDWLGDWAGRGERIRLFSLLRAEHTFLQFNFLAKLFHRRQESEVLGLEEAFIIVHHRISCHILACL